MFTPRHKNTLGKHNFLELLSACGATAKVSEHEEEEKPSENRIWASEKKGAVISRL
jgi:hypothetical protein